MDRRISNELGDLSGHERSSVVGVIDIVPYEPGLNLEGIRKILARNGWEDRYIAGQLDKIDVLSGDPRPGTCGRVYVTESDGALAGFVSIELREWNRLGQLHGLAVDPNLNRRGIASALVSHAEGFVREEEGRGIYVDTPATNEVACRFYLALGYQLVYTMPETTTRDSTASRISSCFQTRNHLTFRKPVRPCRPRLFLASEEYRPNGARKHSKRLRLATVQLPETFSKPC